MFFRFMFSGNMVSVMGSVSSCFQIRIWNHRYEGAQTLSKELTAKGKYAVAYQSAEECVKDADVIVTATFASSPILKGKWIKPGAHINGMSMLTQPNMFKLTFVYALLLRQLATQQHSYWTGMFVDDSSKLRRKSRLVMCCITFRMMARIYDGGPIRLYYYSIIQGDQKVSVHLMITEYRCTETF